MAQELKNIGIDCTVILDSSIGSVMEKIGYKFSLTYYLA